jgi:hypothetical protein
MDSNFFEGITQDQHFKLKLQEGEAPFVLPIFSMYGFDTETVQKYRKEVLEAL